MFLGAILSFILTNVFVIICYLSKDENYMQPFSPEEELKHLEKLKQARILNNKEEEKKTRDILILHNLKLVLSISNKYTPIRSASKEDIISTGVTGLIKAIDTFDIDKNFKLSTYATKCIHNEILMLLRKNNGKDNITVSSSDVITNDKDGNPLEIFNTLTSDINVQDDVEKNILFEKILYIIDNELTEKERYIIKQRYGLGNNKEKTQQQIANELDISRSYISRIETKIIAKIKKIFEKNR